MISEFAISRFIKYVISVMANAEWRRRQRVARECLADYDAGRRCIGCDSTDVVVDGDRVECRFCTHVSSLAALRRAEVSNEEIKELTNLGRV
jgi:hypothetical protein